MCRSIISWSVSAKIRSENTPIKFALVFEFWPIYQEIWLDSIICPRLHSWRSHSLSALGGAWVPQLWYLYSGSSLKSRRESIDSQKCFWNKQHLWDADADAPEQINEVLEQKAIPFGNYSTIFLKPAFAPEFNIIPFARWTDACWASISQRSWCHPGLPLNPHH